MWILLEICFGLSKYTGELKLSIKPFPVVSEAQIISYAEKYLFTACM